MEFRKILFPVDFSDRTSAAAPHVRAVAERFNAEILLLHVVHFPVSYYGVPESAYFAQVDTERSKEEAKTMLSAFETDELWGRKVTRIVEEGDPGNTVAMVAKREGVDLVMMPTHGHGLFRWALLGSVTAKVLHDVPCPVWTSVHRAIPSAPEHLRWKAMMCAINTTEDAVGLIRKANELAVSSQAKLWLVHAVATHESGPSRYLDLEFTRFLETSARETIARLQKDANTNLSVCIGAGRIATVIREAALDHDVDLLTIGRGALAEFGGRLRTHEYSVIREAPCPVLSV